MFALLPWGKIAAVVALLVVLAGGAWKVRHGGIVEGRAEVQIKWDKERAETTAAALVASEARRVKDKVLTDANAKVTNDYITQKAQWTATAVINAGKLRDLQAALDRARSQQAPAVAGTVADPRLDIIAECANTVSRLDDKVKSLAGTLTGLQSYVKDVCISH